MMRPSTRSVPSLTLHDISLHEAVSQSHPVPQVHGELCYKIYGTYRPSFKDNLRKIVTLLYEMTCAIANLVQFPIFESFWATSPSLFVILPNNHASLVRGRTLV